MNKVFSEATTSTAFLLTLTKRQCNTLLRLHADAECIAAAHVCIVGVDNLRGLDRRGLVSWRYENGQPNGFNGLTRAGQLMAELLLEAGLTVENTNTLSVIGREQRMAA